MSARKTLFKALIIGVIAVFFTQNAQAQTNCTPVFSHEPGWYSTPISVSISCATQGVIIYYTLNGDNPDSTSSVYNSSLFVNDLSNEPDRLTHIRTTLPTDDSAKHEISFLDRFYPPVAPVRKGTVIRALAVYPDGFSSKIATSTYFIDETGSNRHNFPVFSLVTDFKNLFDDSSGIYHPGANFDGLDFRTANYSQRGSEWERPMHVEFFEADGSFQGGMDAGFRIHGDFSRRASRKSLRMYARSEYSENRFPWALIDHLPHTEYRRFILRNSGQDVYASQFLDAYNQGIIAKNNKPGTNVPTPIGTTIAKSVTSDNSSYVSIPHSSITGANLSGTTITTSGSRPAIVYINGEYWGIHNIREYLDDRFIENAYSTPRDLVDFLESDAEIKEGSNAHYLALIDFVTNNDLSIPANLLEVESRMDLQSYIDFYVYQIYIANVDWPAKNILYWRRNTSEYLPNAIFGNDGRWRWVVHDTDGGVSWATYSTNNVLATALEAGNLGWPNPDWSTLLFRKLMENTDFRNEFINRSADLMNSVFLSSVMQTQLDSMVALYTPEMPNHIDRWRRPENMSEWNAPINAMREFIAARKTHNSSHIRNQFGIDGMFNLAIQNDHTDKGNVVVNRLILNENTPGVVNALVAKTRNGENDTQSHGAGTEKDPAKFENELIEMFSGGEQDPRWVELGASPDFRMTNFRNSSAAKQLAQSGGFYSATGTLQWHGSYFRNVPVRVTAIPAPGYRVSGWLRNGEIVEGSSIEISSTGEALTVEPIFEVFEEEVVDLMNPIPHILAASDYLFDSWSPDEPEGSFPQSMVFLQTSSNDPSVNAVMTHAYHIPFTDATNNEYHANDFDKIGFPYKLTGRTRLNALGDNGISMINTGRGRDLGAVLLALDTRGVENVFVSFVSGTVIPNSRVYNIRLQYRIGYDTTWQDVTTNDGIPIVYQRNAVAGHSQNFTDISLPEAAVGQELVQLQWRYYFTGQRLSIESGARDMLRLDNIQVTAAPITSIRDSESLPNRTALLPNFPNPFNPTTTIAYNLQEADFLSIEVFAITGQRVAVLYDGFQQIGENAVTFDASGLASGLYIVRLRTSEHQDVRPIMLLK